MSSPTPSTCTIMPNSALTLAPAPALTLDSTPSHTHPIFPVITTSSSNTSNNHLQDGYVHLSTLYKGNLYIYDKDPFTPNSHKVYDCTSRPPVVLSLGMKIALETVTGEIFKGELKSIHGLKSGQVRFVLQLDQPKSSYVILQVHLQFTRLPWHWRSVVALYRIFGKEDY
jgi:hypothetical protein